MSISAAILLFFALLVLAALPSSSVVLVVARSAVHGVSNGAAAALGIVLADVVFVVLAIMGMSFLAETMGPFFAVLKLLAGLYLIYLGVGLFRSKSPIAMEAHNLKQSTLITSFLAGFILTLGDVKAILFYASLFPVFVDLPRLQTHGILLIVLITFLTVGGVKLGYAFAAQALVSRFKSINHKNHLPKAAGCILIGTGTYLLVRIIDHGFLRPLF